MKDSALSLLFLWCANVHLYHFFFFLTIQVYTHHPDWGRLVVSVALADSTSL